MKKLLFLLFAFVTVTMQAQTANGTETQFEAVQLTNLQTMSTSANVPSIGADGTLGKVAGENITTTIVPSNYSPANNTLKAQIKGIDDRLGQIGNTTAGITNRIFFTGDNVTVTAGTFFASNGSGKGTATSGLPTPLVNGDNQKQYFVKDLISIAQPSATTAPPGNYSGQLTVSSTPTPNGTFQRYTIEIYKTNNGGTPIASGITGAPTGSLGVTVVAILDSGQINLVAGAITNISLNGNLASTLSLATGERLRYHVSAQKVGTGGGNVTMSVLYGSDYNSYYDVTVTQKASTVINDSGVVGGNVADAFNTLNTTKQNVITNPITGTGTTGFIPIFTSSSDLGNSIISGSPSDIFINGRLGIGTSSLASFVVKTNSTGSAFNIVNRNANDVANLMFYDTNGVTPIHGIGNSNGKFRIYFGGVADANTDLEIFNKTFMFNTGSGITTDPTTQLDGTLRFSNISAAMAPAISGKSNVAQGLTMQGVTVDGAALDMLFDVRTNLNGDYTTLTNTAYRFRRFGTTLLNILRNGQIQVPNLSGTVIRTIVADASGNLLATSTPPDSRPYKVYTALISQTGTAAPTAVVLENTLGGTVVLSYVSVGTYDLTLTGAFNTNKTIVFLTKQYNSSPNIILSGSYFSTNSVRILTSNNTALQDSQLSGASIEIKVYP